MKTILQSLCLLSLLSMPLRADTPSAPVARRQVFPIPQQEIQIERHDVVVVIVVPSTPKPTEIRVPWTISGLGETLQYMTGGDLDLSLTVGESSKDSVFLNYRVARSSGPAGGFDVRSTADFKLGKPLAISINKEQAISITLEPAP